VLWLWCATGWAQGLTLERARGLAEAHAPDVALAQERAALALTDIDASTELANPSLTVLSGLKTARLGTTVSVPLLLFGQRGATRDALTRDAAAAALDVEATRRQARWAGSQAWLELWEAQARAQLLEGAVADAARLASMTQERTDAGASPRVDALRSGADLARARADATQAHELVAAAALRLAGALALDVEGPLSAEGVATFSEGTLQLESLFSSSEQHPALGREREHLRAAELHLEAERRQRWPLVTPQVSLNQFDPSFSGPDFIFGLSVELPVLSQRSGPVGRATAQQHLAQTSLALQRRALRTALQEGARRATGAHARVLALRAEVLPALEETRKLTDEGYQAGYFDLVRVLDARRTLLETKLALVEAEAAWARAMNDVELAAGVSLLEGAHAK
jgi:cobalt-zinc-cadmium efflux system outer membrane protein